MKIAQVSPLYESVPPKLYGGTERVVSFLTEELVRLGHEVTLFASGDSLTSARLVSVTPQALRLKEGCVDMTAHHIIQQEEIIESIEEFDIVHYHTDYSHFPISRRLTTPSVTTLHGRLDIEDLQPLYKKFQEMPLVSISDSQRQPLDVVHPNWIKTIYHGLPLRLYQPSYVGGNYLAFLGRISPEKRVDRAIEIAKQTGIPLKIAAKVDKVDQKYFDREIRHLLDHPLIEFIGEIGEREKQDFLANAKCLLFPIDWPEPFGLVMIEAMACGTPTVAFRRGSVPEVIHNGMSGYIVENNEEAVRAVRRIEDLDRRGVRSQFEERFSVTRMAMQYLDVYRQLVDRSESWLTFTSIEKVSVDGIHVH